jgi:hypothetical protein
LVVAATWAPSMGAGCHCILQRPTSSHLGKNAPSLQGIGAANMA